MGWLEGRHDGRQIVLDVAILGSRNTNDITNRAYPALLDTGASTCGIGPRVIDDFAMRSHQKKPLAVATELRMVDFYFFRVGLFAQTDRDNGSALPYIFPEIQGFSWLEQKAFDIILGMDVLRQCDLHVDRNRNWRLDFG